MVALVAVAQIQKDKLEQALVACRTVRGPSVLETGCLRYNFYQQPDSPTEIVFVEEWTDRAALDAHFQLPHFLDFMSEMSPLMSAPPHIRIYEVTSYDDV